MRQYSRAATGEPLQEVVWPVRPDLEVLSGIPLPANLIGPVAASMRKPSESKTKKA
jgi:hypothetical protein